MKIFAWRGFFLAYLLAVPLLGAAIAPDETVFIPRGQYAEFAEREIDAARESIVLYLYLFALHAADSNAGPARLARALVRARKRGVSVQVTLDRNPDLDPTVGEARNRAAAQALTAGGVDVFFTKGPSALHAKVLIVDGRAVILGSSNWSATAFEKNWEADVLLRSPAAARQALNSFAGLERRRFAPAEADGLPLPASFVLQPDKLGKLVQARDPLALDAYLFLLRQNIPWDTPTPVDAEAFARALGLSGPTAVDDRRRLRRFLLRLQDRVGVLTFETRLNQDPLITLAAPSDDKVILLPAAYFAQGWDRRLPFAGKTALLLSLAYAADSSRAPRWSVALSTLSRRHGMSRWFLNQGFIALRRLDLIEIEHAPLPPPGEHRPPNTYTPRPFYDPAARDALMEKLAARFGADALRRARRLAALVYEDMDVEGIEELLKLQEQLGPAALDAAARQLGAKSPDNPHRRMGYLLGILRQQL